MTERKRINFKQVDVFQEGENGIPKDENNQLIFSDVDYVDTWKAMEECVKQGLTKSIGLSNFNSEQIQRVLDIASIKPVVNQVLVLNCGHHKCIKTDAVLLM
jgi:diketogulonate reductase-like aldo/keto reductase